MQIVQQIEKFNPLIGCEQCQYMVRNTYLCLLLCYTIDKCLLLCGTKVTMCCFIFQLVSATPVSVKANHTSPDGLQAEGLTFTFSPIMTGGCRVTVSINNANF